MRTQSGQTALNRPLKIGAKTAKNRFCIQPMECCDSDGKGLFTGTAVKRYTDYMKGGAGIVVMESVTLQYESRSTKNQLLLNPKDSENRRAWEKFMKKQKSQSPDTIFLVQLNHAGEFASDTFSEKICVKPHPAFGGRRVDAAYVDHVIKQYIEAARFLYQIGCDGVDLKFCHGYLGSQILRPYNDREWKYGGNWENRSRFAFSICEGIRRAVPDRHFLVGAKISVYEGITGGQGHKGPASDRIDVSESIALCRGLEARGADFFIESLGNARLAWSLMAPGPDSRNLVYLHLAAAKLLKENLKPETAVIGGGLSVLGRECFFSVINTAVEKGIFDAAALGRQALADPYLPQKYLLETGEAIHWCRCCDLCGKLLAGQDKVKCVVYNNEQ